MFTSFYAAAAENILCLQFGMEEPKYKFIVLRDCVGYKRKTVWQLVLPFFWDNRTTEVRRGELLEALPEAEQPLDSTRIALVGIDCKSLHLKCRRTEDLARLSDEDANLLLAISSLELRYETFIDKQRLSFGRRLLLGSEVFVAVKGIAGDLPGVVWYKGEVPPLPGTVFGVELPVSSLFAAIFIKDIIIYACLDHKSRKFLGFQNSNMIAK